MAITQGLLRQMMVSHSQQQALWMKTQRNITNNKKKHITCFKCKETGHYSDECPNANDDEPTKNKKAPIFWYSTRIMTAQKKKQN